MRSTSGSDGFPGFGKLYWFYASVPGTYLSVRMKFDKPEAIALQKAELIPNKPIICVQDKHSGRKAFDVIPTTWQTILISDRVVGLLRDNRITGWKTYPVEISFIDGEPLPGYHGLAITGRCGPFDQSKSRIVTVEYPGGPRRKWKGYYFDPGSWDGSDFFMCADHTIWELCTDRVRRLFKKEKVKSVYFHSLDEKLWVDSPDDPETY